MLEKFLCFASMWLIYFVYDNKSSKVCFPVAREMECMPEMIEQVHAYRVRTYLYIIQLCASIENSLSVVYTITKEKLEAIIRDKTTNV